MLNYEGSIEDVLRSGEYDAGDVCTVDYDELYDLVEQAQFWAATVRGLGSAWSHLEAALERQTNRPLHPVLGGKSPYTGYLPL